MSVNFSKYCCHRKRLHWHEEVYIIFFATFCVFLYFSSDKGIVTAAEFILIPSIYYFFQLLCPNSISMGTIGVNGLWILFFKCLLWRLRLNGTEVGMDLPESSHVKDVFLKWAYHFTTRVHIINMHLYSPLIGSARGISSCCRLIGQVQDKHHIYVLKLFLRYQLYRGKYYLCIH